MRPLVLGAVLSLAVLAGGAASAATLEIKDAWIRSTTPGMPTAVAYATIVNHGFTSDRLTDIGGGPTFYSCLVDVEKCGD